MIDINLIRTNPELVKENIKRKKHTPHGNKHKIFHQVSPCVTVNRIDQKNQSADQPQK